MKLKQKEDIGYRVAGHVILAMLSLLAIIPFWLLIAASFSDAGYATREGYKFFPQVTSLSAYAYILQEWDQIGRSYLVTISVTLIGTATSILIVSLFSYALTKQQVRGMKFVFILVLITMLFNGGIVPQYLIYTNVLRIKNTLFALLVPNLLFNAFNVILVKNFIQHNVPGELLEAAEIDGAGQMRIYAKIVLPMTTPILATVGLMTAIAYWNDWTNGLYYITDPRLNSIQQLLNSMNNNIAFLANNANKIQGVDLSTLPSATIRLAIAVIAILPIIIIYPFFQKYFAKGIAIGAVKG